jgi:DNA helicase-2/ATP-dependent DNA helicase PcrA
MTGVAGISNRTLDDHVDDEIKACLNLDKPNSFFLFAGAGSGKTRSLVKGLLHIRDSFGDSLRISGQRVGVITYTNAACDEIFSRLQANPLFHVSTIHSFAWMLIQGYNGDIREFLRASIAEDLRETEGLQAKGKSNSKAAITRASRIESLKRRLEGLDQIKRFTYNPNGDNRETTSLNHAEVINIAATFISERPTMQRILTQRYPFLLVDESQDTNKLLVDALLTAEAAARGKFALGFFGDMMQRIYADGKDGFETIIPASWSKPEKKLNFRCPQRVLRLINKIRTEVDAHQQVAPDNTPEGLVRVFLLKSDVADKPAAEVQIREQMAALATDEAWKTRDKCKILALEHHMAASRMGFSGVYKSLNSVEQYRTGLLDGTLPIVRIFADSILKVVQAEQAGEKFATAQVVRDKSPLISSSVLQASTNPQANISSARDAVSSLMALWDSRVPTCGDVITNIARTNLFEIPEALVTVLKAREKIAELNAPVTEDAGDEVDDRSKAIDAFLNTSFDEIAPYAQYVSGTAPYDTHQGVKGLEFERVMVLIDDGDARGFMFGYNKLLGAEQMSETDRKNKAEGRDNVIDRTRRLLYVTCSRAKNSLALVVYTTDPAAVRAHIVRSGWFEDKEIVIA